MGRKKKEQRVFAPGGSDMHMSEAFERVLRMAKGKALDNNKERNKEAIELVYALGHGSFSLDRHDRKVKEDLEI